MPSFHQPSSRNPNLVQTFAALALLWIALLLPNRASEINAAAFACLPFEALLLAGLLLFPGSWGWLMRLAAAGTLGFGIIFKLVDLGIDQAFGRPFNPVLDSRFPADGMQWLTGSLGTPGAWLAVALIASLLIGLILLVGIALGQLQAILSSPRIPAKQALTAMFLFWLGLQLSGNPIAGTPFIDWVAAHWHSARDSFADLEGFQRSVEHDPYAQTQDQALLSKLRGKDVLLVFVESYGRTVFDKPDYAAHILPLLEKSGAELQDSGIGVRSAFLTSPTYGGISWLAHGTLLSGLWIDSQSRYDRLVMSQRPTLNHLFQRAGWRTIAVQPAHTLPWPQGQYFGYDRIYAAQDLAYRGNAFNWITMPDQYTLSAIQRLERPAGPRPPVMAEIALISSHAPWTPLPCLLDWQQVGDGSIFSQARDGDAPAAVWQSTERIRQQYRKSIAYVLQTLVSYAKTYGDDKLVILVLGDHQPASFVTDNSASHDVPVHLIARDPEVIRAIDSWHWTPGLIPSAQTPVWGMDGLRGQWVEAFSAEQGD